MLTANSLASRHGTSCSLILEGAGRLSAGRPRTTHCFSAILSRGLPARFCSPGPEENELISGILDSAGTKRAVYFPSSIVQFIALARRAKLFLGGDTGPLHLAAAVGTPLVAIHGPTDPARNGPFNKADIALYNQAPVNHTRRDSNATYIEGISVESVQAAIEARLARVNA